MTSAFRLRQLAWLLLMGIGSPLLAADRLETVEVVDTSGPVYLETADDLEQQRQTIPGGTNLVDLEQATSLTTLSSALNYQPGVIVQEFFGGLDQPRLNVRGSGIQGNPVSRGVLLRQDHLPLNEADGSFIIGLLDLRNTALISINRGANSRVPGSFTLGGDLNFISWQGDTGTRMQMERGSFGQNAVLAVHSGAVDDLLYRLSLSEEKAEGYRHHSASDSRHYALSLAAPLLDGVQTQWSLNHADIGFEMPFVLTRERAENAPETVFGDGDALLDIGMNIYRRDPHRATTQTRLANRTRLLTARGEHSAGIYWQHTDDTFVDPFTWTATDTDTQGVQWIYDHTTNDYFRWEVGLDLNRSHMPRTWTGIHPLSGARIGSAFGDMDLVAANQALSVQTDLVLLPEWTLNAQWQWGESRRDIDDRLNGGGQDRTWHYSLPKLGLIYRPALSDSRWYANLSRSVEVPTFWELVGVDVNPLLTWLSTTRVQDLRVQEAVSGEVGVEHRLADGLSVQATVYRSHLQHELISTASQFGVIADTTNYDGRTVHQGIEFGLNGQQDWRRHGLDYRLSWTWSDFFFDEGIYAGNRIAGVPENLILAETLLRQGSFRFGPTLRWVPDDNPVDHANRLGQGEYLLLGFKADYHYRDRLRTWLELDNLADTRYNASFVVRSDSSATLPALLAGSDGDTLPTFLPGNGFSARLGVRLDF